MSVYLRLLQLQFSTREGNERSADEEVFVQYKHYKQRTHDPPRLEGRSFSTSSNGPPTYRMLVARETDGAAAGGGRRAGPQA